MTRVNLFVYFILFAVLSGGCGHQDGPETDSPEMTFAGDDGSVVLAGSSCRKVSRLLQEAGPGMAGELGNINISPEEYEEISQFVSSLVDDGMTDEKKYYTIYEWMHANIEYGTTYEDNTYVNNDPYPVFTKRKAVCQGYANLMHVMLHTQHIPALNVIGFYVGVGAHAWLYVYTGEWRVSDPTNHGEWRMEEFEKYEHLDPLSIDAVVFSNGEMACNYEEYNLNICEIKTEKEKFIVPFSIQGLRITSLNVKRPLPESLHELYVARNIVTLGEHDMGLSRIANRLKAVHIEDGNPVMSSSDGVVYRNNGSDYTLLYVPAAMETLHLRPFRVLEKNLVFNHAYLKEVIVAEGTEKIEAYAFEKCPRLRKAFLPQGISVAENAFVGAGSDFEIIYR